MKVSEIKPLLKARGMSHAALAKRLKISRVHVTQMLNGKKRMNVDTMSAIETILAEPAASARRVAETASAFAHRSPPRSLTLEEARKVEPAPKLSDEERERVLHELRELGEAFKSLPRITDLSDDEILGYDELGIPSQ